MQQNNSSKKQGGSKAIVGGFSWKILDVSQTFGTLNLTWR